MLMGKLTLHCSRSGPNLLKGDGLRDSGQSQPMLNILLAIEFVSGMAETNRKILGGFLEINILNCNVIFSDLLISCRDVRLVTAIVTLLLASE